MREAIGHHLPDASVRALAVALLLSAIASPLSAAELLMYTDPSCGPCRLFEHEVGGIYAKTAEHQRAPLRRVEIHAAQPDDLYGVEVPAVAPTFVLIDAGREIGRFSGYANDELFWLSLTALLERLPD
ncbi:thioredoxin family protein [Sinimarinibacterium sp. CAU 1509]|uniref:thioredoxin family protein n=1 Tax=Sinimarinibacterium sp. CAU 1509 TaxID=2562283 RepID=UPI0010AD9927|nr:thioredoxin family protein [Sinimarinibacterium sp. CAU 1509]TJY64845.1 thioredoxin family protein [Sinimarinibacterium sp. CAU 1509]